MRHGTQLAPDGTVPASHEYARCDACQSILYDVPVLLDGCPIGKVAWRCPHCHDRRPLPAPTVARHRSVVVEVDHTRQEFLRRRAQKAAQTRGVPDDAQRARAIRLVRRYAAAVGRTPTYAELGQGGPSIVPGLQSLTMLRRLFGGTLRNLIVAAGLTPRASGFTAARDRARGVA